MLFFLSGLALIPYIGIQTDEALFGSVLFDNPSVLFSISVFKKKYALMVMTYLGTVKSALYWVIWKLFDPDVYSVRVPALAIGTASIVSFHMFLRLATNVRVAWLGTALLATDTGYLLTTTMDWGPVAIQHLCLITGLMLVLKFCQTGGLASLAWGSWWLGVGMWDKALFVWMLSAAILSAAIVFFTELTRILKLRSIIVAIIFFLVGALPLVIYNVRRPLQTFRTNTTLSSDDWNVKFLQLPGVANGSGLYGYMVEEDWATEHPHAASNALEKASYGLGRLAGDWRISRRWWVLVGALAMAPLLLFTRWRRPVGFCILLMGIGWAEMIATKGAGGGAHHTVLLWPFPLMLIAIAAVWISEKLPKGGTAFVVAVGVICSLQGLLATNHFLAQGIRNGAAGAWTTAHYNLVRRLAEYYPAPVFLVDWGMMDNTRVLFRGNLRLYHAGEPLARPDPTEQDLKLMKTFFEWKDAIFVGNTDKRQMNPDVNKRLQAIADRLGYRKELVEVIYDYQGRPSYEVMRFHQEKHQESGVRRQKAGVQP